MIRAAHVVRRLLFWLVALFLGWLALVAALMILYAYVPPVSTLMLGRWATFQGVERRFVPLASISSQLPRAVVMSEDARFCRHGGVDWDALGQVLTEADEDGPSRGASTLTMQLVKNLFLWPGRSYIRKALEIPLAVVLDVVWSKKRIMEAYLNVAEWGDGVFGAEAAARRAFGKGAAALNAREAALLATALPNPILREAARPTRRHAVLAGIIARRAASGVTWTDCLR
ncbi:MAG: monofunctional biosynthetic peptidoglycan transglycosylase [Hyphomicrobiales bacterium]|nr:monofunctional biosynthetic peptidoglycan transglycosylase [Hyphomicrobiales bacterium]